MSCRREKKAISFRKSLQTLIKAAEKMVQNIAEQKRLNEEVSEACSMVAAKNSLQPLLDIYIFPVQDR